MFNNTISINGMDINRIGLGTSGFGGYFEEANYEKKKILDIFYYAFDKNIRFIDTAESYASGETEKIIGSLNNSVKNNFILASKFKLTTSNYNNIEKSLDSTLKRIKRDFIDVYMPHWPNHEIETELVLNSLKILKKKGKIKFIGLSNYENFDEIIKLKDLDFIESEFNLFYQKPINKLFPKLHYANKFFIGYSPFKNGIIFNKNTQAYFYLNNLSQMYNVSISQIVLLWILSHSNNLITIPKTQNVARLKQYCDIDKIHPDLVINIIEGINGYEFDKITPINVNNIKMCPDGDRPVYYSLSDALENKFNLFPDVVSIAEEIKNNNGMLTKPIRLIKNKKSNQYYCLDGRLKYWAWVYLYGSNSEIQSVIF